MFLNFPHTPLAKRLLDAWGWFSIGFTLAWIPLALQGLRILVAWLLFDPP